MRPELREAVEEWLIRAERDLLAAEKLLQPPAVLGDGSTYHAQQAAEKALKGFLVAHDVGFALTHDVSRLVVQCQAVADEFGTLANAAAILTPYAVRFRYPGGPLEPSVSETRRAFQLATEIVQFVRGQLDIQR